MKRFLSLLFTVCVLLTISYNGADPVSASQSEGAPVISMEIGGYTDKEQRGFFSKSTVREGRAKTSAEAGERIVVSFILSGISRVEYYQLSGIYDESLLSPGYYSAAGIWTEGDGEKDFNTVIDGSESFTSSKFDDSLSFTRSQTAPTVYICGYSLTGTVSLPRETQFESGAAAEGAVLASVGFEVLDDISNIYDAFQWDGDTSVSVSLDEEYLLVGGLTVACRHIYDIIVTAPGCDTDGHTVYSCVYCPDAYKGDYTSATGHFYIVNGSPADGRFSYTCESCGGSALKTYRDLSMMWRTKYINTAPDTTAFNSTCFIDVVRDGVINAKDYALICQSE